MGNRSLSIMDQQYKLESADIVIVGNGIAGLTTAVEARRLSPQARIAIITEQCHPTINTPALKQFAIGKLTQEQLLAYPPGTERAQRIHVINARVEEINAQGKFLNLRGGYTFGYSSLLLATGSVSNGLPAHLPGRDFDGVLTLHCLQDYLDLRRRLGEVDSAVVIGGGAHAIDTVMGLLHHGVEVHWLIRGETFLSRMLDQTASEIVLETMRSAGAKIATQTEVIGIVGRVGSVVGVVTNQHEMIPCQLVLVCTGMSPVTTLAEHCNMPMMYKRGIWVDEQFRTSVQGIYAVGDAAARKNPQTGAYETQAQWYAAVSQGRTVAALMTGQHELAAKPMGVPWHATHLGELFMLNVGNPLHKFAGSITLTNNSKKRYCRMSIIDDRLVGYLSLGSVQPDSLAIKRIIDEGLSIRSVKKALLKGDFDARKYFSQWRSREAQDMVTSGKLPVVKPMYYPVLPPVRTIPVVAHPLVAAQQSRGVSSTSVPTPQLSPVARMGTRQTEPLRGLEPAVLPLSDQLTIHGWEYDQPTIHEWEEDMRPSTGDLPVPPNKVVESILMSLPSRSVTRNLWSYSEKIPEDKAGKDASGKPELPWTEKTRHDDQTHSVNFML